MSLEQTAELQDLQQANLLAVRVFRDVAGLPDPTPAISHDHFVAGVALAFAFGMAVSGNRRLGRRTCRVCGCWEFSACSDERGPCWWVEADLCSHCVPEA